MKLFGFDSETFLFREGLAAPRLVCGSYADETKARILAAPDLVRFFRWALERGHHLAGVHIAYDVVVLAAYDPTLIPLIFKAGNAGQFHCVAVREALHDIASDKLFINYKTGKSFAKGDDMGGRYSQAILMERHFGIDISADKHGDVWRFKFAKLEGVPVEEYPPEASAYMLKDANYPLQIFHKQAGHKNLHDEAAQVRASIAIEFMCAWGFRTDGAYLASLEADVDSIWNAARVEFAKAGIFREDGTKDTKRLKDLVTVAYDGSPPKTPKGGVSCDRDTLEESGVEILVKLGTSGKNDKRKTQYIPALKKGTRVPINPEFNVLVNTGRLSSNFQQLPQKGGIREAVVPRGHLYRLLTGLEPEDDSVILSCDYGGLELRTMAQRAIYAVKFSKMAEFINQGKDVHTYVAAYFEGCTYEEMLVRVKAKEPRAVAMRALAKIFNFGKGGGMGAGAMAYNARQGKGEFTTAPDGTVYTGNRFCILTGRSVACGVRKEDVRIQGKIKRVCSLCIQISRELGDKWLKAWPEQGLLFKEAKRLTQGGRKVHSVTFGSKRVRGGCGYTQWLNNPFQGAGGDGCKAAMWRIAEKTYSDPRSPMWGTRVFLNVHDELLAEVPWERRHDSSFAFAAEMVQVMDQVTPDVKNEVKPAIMRRLFKAASDVYSKDGLLNPWWPKDWAWAPDAEVMARDLAS